MFFACCPSWAGVSGRGTPDPSDPFAGVEDGERVATATKGEEALGVGVTVGAIEITGLTASAISLDPLEPGEALTLGVTVGSTVTFEDPSSDVVTEGCGEADTVLVDVGADDTALGLRAGEDVPAEGAPGDVDIEIEGDRKADGAGPDEEIGADDDVTDSDELGGIDTVVEGCCETDNEMSDAEPEGTVLDELGIADEVSDEEELGVAKTVVLPELEGATSEEEIGSCELDEAGDEATTTAVIDD